MLVLSRKLGESIIVDDLAMRIVVVSIDRGKVRLGIEAPDETTIDREEIYRAKRSLPATAVLPVVGHGPAGEVAP